MSINEIFGVLDKVFSWWTPEQVKARAKDKIKRLKDEKKQLLKQPFSTSNASRVDAIESELDKLQEYIKNH